MNREPKLIHDNDMFKVYLIKYAPSQYIISVHEQFAHLAIKKWIVAKVQSKWYIKNHQYKQGPATDMEYEWVSYPIPFNTLKGLISDFTELTANFTHYFPFPKE